MVRLIGFLVGAAFCFVLFIAAIQPRDSDPVAPHGEEAPHYAWTFNGPMGLGVLGKFDNRQLQRGFQVYKEVCSACHGMTLLAFRDLQAIGFSEPEVKAIAKGWDKKIPSISETGEPAERDALPSDRFPPAFPNEVAGRAANNNAYPPDLSLITKAREDGSNYVTALVGHGYDEAARPEGWETPDGLYFNKYYPNLNIAMPPPIAADDQVTYADGTKATIGQMAADVSAFLTWAAEPKAIARKQTGLGVVIFLTILAVLAFLTYLRVWAPIKKGGMDPMPAE